MPHLQNYYQAIQENLLENYENKNKLRQHYWPLLTLSRTRIILQEELVEMIFVDIYDDLIKCFSNWSLGKQKLLRNEK